MFLPYANFYKQGWGYNDKEFVNTGKGFAFRFLG